MVTREYHTTKPNMIPDQATTLKATKTPKEK